MEFSSLKYRLKCFSSQKFLNSTAIAHSKYVIRSLSWVILFENNVLMIFSNTHIKLPNPSSQFWPFNTPGIIKWVLFSRSSHSVHLCTPVPKHLWHQACLITLLNIPSCDISSHHCVFTGIVMKSKITMSWIRSWLQRILMMWNLLCL